jgi:hypothetical protein
MNQRQLELQRDLYRLLLGVDDTNQVIDSVLSAALGLVVRITNARIGYIELRTTEGKQWWSTYHCSENDTETIRRRISTGIVAEAIATCKTIVTPSAFLDPRFSDRESVREGRIEAVLCSPFERDNIVGVIYLQGDDDSDLDDDHCMMETELFAKHISPLLRRLRYQVDGKRSDSDVRRNYDPSGTIGGKRIVRRNEGRPFRHVSRGPLFILRGFERPSRFRCLRNIGKDAWMSFNP